MFIHYCIIKWHSLESQETLQRMLCFTKIEIAGTVYTPEEFWCCHAGIMLIASGVSVKQHLKLIASGVSLLIILISQIAISGSSTLISFSGCFSASLADKRKGERRKKNKNLLTFWMVAALLPWCYWWVMLAVLLARAALKKGRKVLQSA